MVDEHAGEVGTFYNDPDTGTRITEQEWLAKQAQAATKPKIDKVEHEAVNKNPA